MDRFKNRYSLVHKTVSGESKGVNIETATQWKESELIRPLEGYSMEEGSFFHGYSPKDVFNADYFIIFAVSKNTAS